MATDLKSLVLTATAKLFGVATKEKELADSQCPINLTEALAFTFGSGALQADQIFFDRRVLAAGANETLDLSGVLENPLGGTISFANVKGIVIVNRSDETSTSPSHTITDAEIVVGGAAANTFLGPFQDASDKLGIPAGGIVFVARPTAAGWDVVDEYAVVTDQLKIENADGSGEALYDIYIWGDSA